MTPAAEDLLDRIDEHEILVDAGPTQVWSATLSTFTALTTRAGWQLLAKSLRCRPAVTSGSPEVVGATVPGFGVVRSLPGEEWALEGEHRFSRYALTFRITPEDDRGCRLSAESAAVFPGLHGTAYRAMVIGSGGHVVGVKRILRRIKVEAEDIAAASATP